MNQDLHFWRYGLKLRGRPEVGANARSARRVLEGMLIRTAEGGYGCIHPWPELGDEPLRDQWEALHGRRNPTRLMARALVCAGLDGAARREGRSLFEGLTVPPSHATVTGAAFVDFAALRAEGFETVKLKGDRDWKRVLNAMRAAAGAGLAVRVDFNAVLTEAEFLEFAAAAGSEGLGGFVDFIEDPVPYSPEAWRRLKEVTGWRLALDWEYPGGSGAAFLDAFGRRQSDSEGFDLRVIKPAVQAAPESGGVPVVFTSAMDHPLGQLFAAYEAADWLAQGKGQDGNRAPLSGGLLTHRLFEEDDFTRRLGARGPGLRLPGGTGLGFDDLLEALPWQPLVRRGNRGKPGVVFQNPRDPLAGGPPVLEKGETGFPTSGSTGHPSVIVHTDDSLEASAAAVNAWLRAGTDDVWLRVLPFFHVGGRQIQTRAEIAGSRVVAMEEGWKWSAEDFLKTCQAEGVSLASLVPAQVFDLVTAGLSAPDGLRAVLVGGGALEESLWRKACGLGWPVLPSYGSTEAGSTIAAAKLLSGLGGTLDSSAQTRGSGVSIGGMPALELLPGWEARVSDADGSGEGLLELKGPALARFRMVFQQNTDSPAQTGRGEWRRVPLVSAENSGPSAGNGWWRTSDRVRLTGRELLFAGRADRVVKVLGELVNLAAVEQSLAGCGLDPGTFVVLPVRDERRGNLLVLMTERDAPADTPGQYNGQAAPFARIGQVVRVDALPRSALGKVRFEEATKLIPLSLPALLPVPPPPREAPG